MRISFEAVTETLGPGKRYAIWVQGCKKRCKGCINPAGWSLDGGHEKTVEQIYSSIVSQKGLTGVTISGGEPFLQFEELGKLISLIKESTLLDVMVFSGFSVEEIQKTYGENFEKMKKYIDILVDGEYIENLNTGSMYRGSDNQRFFFFTPKYQMYSELMVRSKQRNFSFDILDNGDVYFIGIPPVGFYEKFVNKIGERL